MKPLIDNPKIKRILMCFMLLLVINLPLITAVDLAEISGNGTINGTITNSTNGEELDTTAPTLVVGIPEVVAGDKLDVMGWTEIGAEVRILVNGIVMDKTVAVEAENKNLENITASDSTSPNMTFSIVANESALVGQAMRLIGNAFSEGLKSQELPSGIFQFSQIKLEKNYNNNITIEAEDEAGNVVSLNGITFSDTKVPQIKIGTLPELVDTNSISLSANLTENCKWEILVNNRSQAQGEGIQINETVNLEEGKNSILIKAKDAAGWEKSAQAEIESDSMPPTVSFVIEKGNEYYQGRATSDINGETEPGARVYVYVYKPLGYEYTPKFDKAWAKVTADQNGSFSFSDINFESTPLNWEDLAPEQVPQGLLEYSIFPVELLKDQQQFTYYIFVVAEDKSGKSGYQQATVTVNSCYAGEWAFEIQSLAEFQRPLRLDPELLDSGREAVSAVFNLTYRGNGQTKKDLVTGQIIPGQEAFEIDQLQIDKACTQSMLDDPSYEIACKIFPSSASSKLLPNSDKTAWYTTFNLMSSEELSQDKDFSWNNFRKRQLVFPLKLRLSYRERDSQGMLGATKVQTMCYDLSYFVDMPIDSKDMLPDWMVNEGVKGLENTIKAIDTIIPYLEKAILVTGIGCIGSFLGRLTTRYVRIVTSKLEYYFTRANPDDTKKCPLSQQGLLLDSTIKSWVKLKDSGYFDQPELKSSDPQLKYPGIWDTAEQEKLSLNKKCPMTANMWEIESYLDQAYKWTCDRVFCRVAPARWTATKEKSAVDTVILSQKQCAASSKGIPLILRENCKEIIFGQSTQQIVNPDLNDLRNVGSFSCYQDTRTNQFYYYKQSALADFTKPQIVTLTWLAPLSSNLNDAFAPGGRLSYGNLLAYKPPNSKEVMVGVDQSCENVCRNIVGYKADKGDSSVSVKDQKADSNGGGIENYYVKSDGTVALKSAYGCYRETISTLDGKTYWADRNGELMRGPRFAAGYTQDCFVEVDNSGKQVGITADKTGLLQCVCVLDEKVSPVLSGVRQAGKETDLGSEDWIYREATLNKDNPAWGTYYPEWRYYAGRDMPAAFGANSLTDYLRQNETIHEVNPFTQHIGAFQALCLSGIRARLIALQSILAALKTCLEEAKYTGLKDAGVCKTLFTEQVCGLMYQAIAYFANDCSPLSAQDQAKSGLSGTLDGVGEVSKAALGSISEAMQSSVEDITSDYTNSNLQQTFSGGAKGFAQSLCLAAFGYDWPLGVNFILDSAYATPMATTVMVTPARRELATFNPQIGTAVFDYNIGALVLPGCKIKTVDVSLRCVGKEELIHKGVDCSEQGCDCLNIQEQTAISDADRTYYLDKGRKFNLAPGSLIDLELPSPQKVDKRYRYDHVIVKVQLDPYESAESCFDEGYQDGLYYFPISDVTPENELKCQVQTSTGTYYCPEILAMFGGGAGAYLQDPFISCYEKNTQTWTRCDTPNLFVKGDEIKIKMHVMSDGGKYCLKTSVTGLDAYTKQDFQQLPAGVPGELSQILNLGTVRAETFTGQSTFTLAPGSAPGCSNNLQILTSGVTAPTQSYYFSYQPGTTISGSYIVTIQAGVTVNIPYMIDPTTRRLSLNGQVELTSLQLLQAEFNFNGYKVRGMIGGPNPSTLAPQNVCIYGATGNLYASTANYGGTYSGYSPSLYSPSYGTGYGTTNYIMPMQSISVTAEILLPDQNGGCYNAYMPVRQPAFGRNKFQQTITLQLESLASALASEIHREFLAGNYQAVIQKAVQILDRKQADIEDASAIYYLVSSYMAQAGSSSSVANSPQVLASVCNNLDLFFNRYSFALSQCLTPYPTPLKQSSEYLKINQYLTIIGSGITCPAVSATCPT